MAPNQVSLLNVGSVRRNLYGNVKSKIKFQVRVGDRLRISKSRRTFRKGYVSDWTKEIFTICKRITKERPIYKLTDDSREILEGSFYEEELQKVTKEDNLFCIESILHKQKRGKDIFLLIKWKRVPGKVQWLGLKMRKTSRTYKKNTKVAIGHFLSNRNGLNTGVLSNITK